MRPLMKKKLDAPVVSEMVVHTLGFLVQERVLYKFTLTMEDKHKSH